MIEHTVYYSITLIYLRTRFPAPLILIGVNYRSLCNSYNERKGLKILQEEKYELLVLVSILCMESKYYTKSKSHILSGQHCLNMMRCLLRTWALS